MNRDCVEDNRRGSNILTRARVGGFVRNWRVA